MKKVWRLLVVAGLCAQCAWASGIAGYGSYWKTKDQGDGFGGGAKLKLDLIPQLSLEVRGTYFDNLADKDKWGDGKLQVIPVEGDLVVNLTIAEKLIPYIGGGAGYYFMDGKDPDGNKVDIKDEVGAFAVAGLEIEIGEEVALFAEAKYTWLQIKEVEKVELDTAQKLDGFGANAGLMLKW